MAIDREFTKRLPKIELHAHLNGSIEIPTLRELLIQRRSQDDLPDGIEEALDRYENNFELNEIADFFGLFKYIYPLTSHKEAVIFITTNVVLDFAKDGVVYLELRSTPRSTPHMSKKEYVEAFLDGILKGIEASICQGFNMTARAILSVDRRHSLQEAMEIVRLAELFSGRGVVGIDLCGDPYKGSFDTLKPAFDYAKNAGLKVTLHVGEIQDTELETTAMLDFGPDRIGHGTFLPSTQRLSLVKQNIPIEACVTSNLLCKTVPIVSDHHFKDFHFDGHPCILCTDDKGLFHCALSGEYILVGEAFQLDKNDLFELARRAVDFIFDNNAKDSLHHLFESFRNKEGL